MEPLIIHIRSEWVREFSNSFSLNMNVNAIYCCFHYFILVSLSVCLCSRVSIYLFFLIHQISICSFLCFSWYLWLIPLYLPLYNGNNHYFVEVEVNCFYYLDFASSPSSSSSCVFVVAFSIFHPSKDPSQRIRRTLLKQTRNREWLRRVCVCPSLNR